MSRIILSHARNNHIQPSIITYYSTDTKTQKKKLTASQAKTSWKSCAKTKTMRYAGIARDWFRVSRYGGSDMPALGPSRGGGKE